MACGVGCWSGEARTESGGAAGFYQLSGGRIASAKIYREGSAETS
jgi:hypothetical protein